MGYHAPMARFAEYEPGRRAGPPPPDLRIRDAEERDLDTIAAIRATRGDVPAEKARKGLQKLLLRVEAGEMVLLVAETAGAVAAYGCAARFEPPPGAPHDCAPAGWYLAGVVVAPALRRRGIAAALTGARLSRLPRPVYYFANELNSASIDLHRPVGFVELTRAFWHPDATFTGGKGILFVLSA
jgi:ribosomal protein S18 acetylase RimI-like enzyme